ncbi:MAG TPA: hypothetical protein VN980_18050 [Alphaproteobacteria bacterium]|nr:hypothetical protein [Alphaproteobacteria bacterium]
MKKLTNDALVERFLALIREVRADERRNTIEEIIGAASRGTAADANKRPKGQRHPAPTSAAARPTKWGTATKIIDAVFAANPHQGFRTHEIRQWGIQNLGLEASEVSIRNNLRRRRKASPKTAQLKGGKWFAVVPAKGTPPTETGSVGVRG